MATLTFIQRRENLMAAAEAAPQGANPFLLLRGSDIPAAIEALAAGRDTLALAAAAQHGWHAPKGTVVKMHDDMQHEELEAMRHQCESRIHRVGTPVSVMTLDASTGLDGYVARLSERKRSATEADRGASGHEAAVNDYGALLAALQSAPRKIDFLRHYRNELAKREALKCDDDKPDPEMSF